MPEESHETTGRSMPSIVPLVAIILCSVISTILFKGESGYKPVPEVPDTWRSAPLLWHQGTSTMAWCRSVGDGSMWLARTYGGGVALLESDRACPPPEWTPVEVRTPEDLPVDPDGIRVEWREKDGTE